MNITLESATRVVCTFLGLQDIQMMRQLSCDIVYGPCQKNSKEEIHGKRTSFNTVVIDLPTSIQSNVHCYIVNASNGTFTVLFEGTTGEYMIIRNYFSLV